MITAADLRAELARRQIPLYKLAARVGLHPGRLGMVLNGRAALSSELAQRIVRMLRDQTDPD